MFPCWTMEVPVPFFFAGPISPGLSEELQYVKELNVSAQFGVRGVEEEMKVAFNGLVDRIADEFDDVNKNVMAKVMGCERRVRDVEVGMR